MTVTVTKSHRKINNRSNTTTNYECEGEESKPEKEERNIYNGSPPGDILTYVMEKLMK